MRIERKGQFKVRMCFAYHDKNTAKDALRYFVSTFTNKQSIGEQITNGQIVDSVQLSL